MSKLKYQGYSKGASKEQVKQRFTRKYGYVPSEVKDAGTIWLCGPLQTNNPPRRLDVGGIEQLSLFGGI